MKKFLLSALLVISSLCCDSQQVMNNIACLGEKYKPDDLSVNVLDKRGRLKMRVDSISESCPYPKLRDYIGYPRSADENLVYGYCYVYSPESGQLIEEGWRCYTDSTFKTKISDFAIKCQYKLQEDNEFRCNKQFQREDGSWY